MKTNDHKIAYVLILNAVLAILSLTCCKDDKPAKMLWSVTSHNQDNVEVTFDPTRRPQIEIIANAEGGECKVSCPNYEHISFREQKLRANVLEGHECQFIAEITAPGIITIKLDKMPKDNQELSSYFIIDGDNGDEVGTTVVKVTRKLHTGECFDN